MFRKRKSKKVDEMLTPTLTALLQGDVGIRERTEPAGAHGATPNTHGMSEDDEQLDNHEFTEELRDALDGEAGEVQEGASVQSGRDGEARRTTEDEVAYTVTTIWRRRFEDDPEGALDDLRARVDALGYRLAYAGRTHLAPITKRTYYILDRDVRERIDVFHNGDADLTLHDVCLWSELAFKRWTDSDSRAGSANGRVEGGATTVSGTH